MTFLAYLDDSRTAYASSVTLLLVDGRLSLLFSQTILLWKPQASEYTSTTVGSVLAMKVPSRYPGVVIAMKRAGVAEM